MMVIDLVTLD